MRLPRALTICGGLLVSAASMAFAQAASPGSQATADLPPGLTGGPAQGANAAKALTAPANLTFGTAAGNANGSPAAQLILDATVKDKIGTASFGWGRQHHKFQVAFSGPV